MEKYFIAVLNSISRIGSKTTKKLIDIFGSAENVWNADFVDFAKSVFNQTVTDNFFAFRSKNPNAVERLIEFCNVKKVKICTIFDEEYPPILKELSAAPIVFYYRGELKPNEKRIAIVGSRKATNYGEKVSNMLATELAKAGITIVSGAANGIDTFAHSAALKVGCTVAVLGYGINKIPADKFKLLENIVASGGVVLSDFPPNITGSNRTFPARDRIIAGLSNGVVVVEAGENSGALIAAKVAADNSRDVFAVPDKIFCDNSAGCHKLIRSGAIPVLGVEDILKVLK